jgi:TM2 domain-containing membrane protein YozV
MKNGYTTHPVLVGYLFWIFGIVGTHRFYFGRPLTGLLYLFTGGLLGIGWLVDAFLIPSMSEEADRRYQAGPLDYTIAWVLHVFLGIFGAHHFYMEKWITGLIYLFTGGIFGLGWLYDWTCLNEQVEDANLRMATRFTKAI